MLSTKNSFGKINISDKAIALVASRTAQECYGVVGLEYVKFTDYIMMLIKNKKRVRGIKIETVGSRIFIDVNVIIKYGVSFDAVANTLKSAIKYNVEYFSGMVVDTININIVGVKI